MLGPAIDECSVSKGSINVGKEIQSGSKGSRGR